MFRFLSFLAVLVLVGCQSPTKVIEKPDASPAPSVNTHSVIIKNSLWQTWKTIPVSAVVSGRSVNGIADIPADVQSQLDAYNSTHTSDFLRAFMDIAPSIEESDTVNVFICNPFTNNVNLEADNIPRQSLVDNWAGWQATAQGQVLYIDHVPPPPILDKDVNPYAWYCITVVNTASDGTESIVHVDHCGYNPDQSWTPGTISDWPDVDAYFASMSQLWQTQALLDNANGAANERVILHQVYVIPVQVP